MEGPGIGFSTGGVIMSKTQAPHHLETRNTALMASLCINSFAVQWRLLKRSAPWRDQAEGEEQMK